MAKAKPSPKLAEMESKLGYKIDSETYPGESSKRFYSDLRPIPTGTYGKTRREFEDYEERTYRKCEATTLKRAFSELDVVKVSTFNRRFHTLT